MIRMKIKAGYPEAVHYKLFDCVGRHIRYAKSFDTDTEVAEVFLPSEEGKVILKKEQADKARSIAVATVHLPGAYLTYKGNKIE